jgi:hypothetical protein
MKERDVTWAGEGGKAIQRIILYDYNIMKKNERYKEETRRNART